MRWLLEGLVDWLAARAGRRWRRCRRRSTYRRGVEAARGSPRGARGGVRRAACCSARGRAPREREGPHRRASSTRSGGHGRRRRPGTACAPSATPPTWEKGYDPASEHEQDDVVGGQRRMRSVSRPRIAPRRVGEPAGDGAAGRIAPGPRAADRGPHLDAARRAVLRATRGAQNSAMTITPAAGCSITRCRRCSRRTCTTPTGSSRTRSTSTRRSCRARCTRAA